jgi:hypothetical protein
MKISIAVWVVGLLAAGQAHADGFNCQTLENDLNARVYNHTQPDDGTRNVAILVLSDPAVQSGRKTIAKFTDAQSTVSNTNAIYVADVDLRMRESNRGGERISGTLLRHLDQIILDIDFSYADPVEDGATTTAELTLLKRNGQRIHREMECTRYLKN